jgi:hypothetical protein
MNDVHAALEQQILIAQIRHNNALSGINTNNQVKCWLGFA